MEFQFLCSNSERKVYEQSIGSEVIVSINSMQSKCTVKSVDNSGNVIVETDDEISKILKDKIRC